MFCPFKEIINEEMRIRRREYEMPAPPRDYEERFPQVLVFIVKNKVISY